MRKMMIVLYASLLAASCKTGPAENAVAIQPSQPRHDFKFIGYDAASCTLAIQFNDGAISNFAGVAEGIYVDLMRSSSKMSFFTNNIGNRYASKPGG